MRALNAVLEDKDNNCTLIYIDDISVLSAGIFQRHVDHLKRISNRLQSAGKTINLAKSSFFREQMTFVK